MANLTDKPTAELHTLHSKVQETLSALVESLEEREDMQGVVRRLMAPDDTLLAFSKISVEDPDLARIVLEAGVTALVNTQGLMALEAELKRRIDRN